MALLMWTKKPMVYADTRVPVVVIGDTIVMS